MRRKDPSRVSSENRDGSPGDANIRRASYYVWFLGMEDCVGFRGREVVRPVVQNLLLKERTREPHKVTLQVSAKGVKLLQQNGVQHTRSSSGGNGGYRHFIPSSGVTYIQVEEPPDADVVSVIVFAPKAYSGRPRLHAFRCDSTETAELLCNHMKQLQQKAENHSSRKGHEGRTTAAAASSGVGMGSSIGVGCDGVSSGGSYTSSGDSGPLGRTPSGERITTLYDSLAAELREKLGNRGGPGGPLLLPPRDYEKGEREKGQRGARGGDTGGHRRSLEEDSARSSGIGSEDPPSPTQDGDYRMDQDSSSEDEWMGGSPGLGSYAWGEMPPLRIPRQSTRGRLRDVPRKQGGREPSPFKKLQRRTSRYIRDRSESPGSPRERFHDARDKFLSLERHRSAGDPTRQRSPSWDHAPKGMGPLRVALDPRLARKHRPQDNRDDVCGHWPKRDSDTGYGSRDGLLRERRVGRDLDRGYGTGDTLDSDPWPGCRGGIASQQEPWDVKGGRQQDPDIGSPKNREHHPHQRLQQTQQIHLRSPERHHDYMRARSMHDLSQRRPLPESDARRRSLYEHSDDALFREIRRPSFGSQAHLTHIGAAVGGHGMGGIRPQSPSTLSSTSASGGPSCARRYSELPDGQRFPGLDRATARPDPLDHHHQQQQRNKRTFDYPVNGGHAPIHIARAHDDYRRFRYDYTSNNSSNNVNSHYPIAAQFS